MGRAMFLSTVTNALDAKGRVSVPAEFRSAVRDQDFEGVFCWRSFNGDYLEGGGQALMDRMARMVETMDPYADEREAFEEVIFSDARRLNFDANGRVVLPKDLCEHAGIEREVRFVGRGERFQIWAPERHEEWRAQALQFARENRHKMRLGVKPAVNGEGRA